MFKDISIKDYDPDLYQDANRIREEEFEREKDQEKSRGFRR